MKLPDFFLPSHFYLKGRRWTIELVDDLGYMTKKNGQKVRIIGECDGGARRIEILDKIPPRKQIETLVHEFYHAMEYELGLRIPHDMIYKTDKHMGYLFMLLMASQPKRRGRAGSARRRSQ